MKGDMFTPELVNEGTGEYVLVANHALETGEAVELSIAFNRCRIEHAKRHLPPHVRRCHLVYDIRGQRVPEEIAARLRQEFDAICQFRIKQ